MSLASGKVTIIPILRLIVACEDKLNSTQGNESTLNRDRHGVLVQDLEHLRHADLAVADEVFEDDALLSIVAIPPLASRLKVSRRVLSEGLVGLASARRAPDDFYRWGDLAITLSQTGGAIGAERSMVANHGGKVGVPKLSVGGS